MVNRGQKELSMLRCVKCHVQVKPGPELEDIDDPHSVWVSCSSPRSQLKSTSVEEILAVPAGTDTSCA